MTATPVISVQATPHPIRPLQMALAMRSDPLGLLTSLARQHGDIADLSIGRRRVLLLSHPELVREVLVTQQRSFVKGEGLQRARALLGQGLLTSEGAQHLRQRRLVQPAFHRERIAKYATVMSGATERASAGWRDGTQIDVAHEMMRLTLAIAGKTLFDADVERDAEHVGRALDELMGLFGLLMLPFGPLLERLPIGPGRRMRAARARLDAVIGRLIAERRATGDRGDLLSMLLSAQGGDSDGGGMSDQQVRDEAMTLFLAGHETTASALSWTWYLLAQHPEVERRLHAEIDRALGGRTPTMDDVAQLPFTRAVFSEAIRLFPPAWVIGRQAIAPVMVGGYAIPSGTTVLVSPYVIHHDARFFPDPERFDPARWLHEGPERPRMAYFPFGAGTRMCVGEGFAWMEGTLVLATIARQWQLRLAPHAHVRPRPAVTLRPGGAIPMQLIARQAAPTHGGVPTPTNGGCPFHS